MATLNFQYHFDSGAYYAYASESDRDKPEWPPHPARFYSALTAAHFALGDAEDTRKALEWLATLPPPMIAAPAAVSSSAYPAYVPVNISLTEKGQDRQEKVFACTHLSVPRVAFVYADVEESALEAHRGPLSRLCEGVPYFGNSRTLGRAEVAVSVDSTGMETWVPSEYGVGIRTVSPNQLALLEMEHQKERKGSGNFLPAVVTPYLIASAKSTDIFSTDFAKGVVLTRTGGAKVSGSRALDFVIAFRHALCAYGPSQFLSGHQEDGSKSREEHLYVLPLISVGGEHADGEVKALWLTWKNGVSPGDLYKILPKMESSRAVDEEDESDAPVWEFQGMFLRRHVGGDAKAKLATHRLSTWQGPSRVWTSVTPMLLDKVTMNNKGILGNLLRHVRFAGLPVPVRVEILTANSMCGSVSSQGLRDPKDLGRKYCHFRLTFDTIISGPVVLGNARYQGFGLFRP